MSYWLAVGIHEEKNFTAFCVVVVIELAATMFSFSQMKCFGNKWGWKVDDMIFYIFNPKTRISLF